VENNQNSRVDAWSAILIDRPRLVVADDDPSSRCLPERALEREAIQVVLANNSFEALEAVHRYDFSVAPLDVQMPILDGLETLRRIQADDRPRALPVMLLTGESDAEGRVHCLASAGTTRVPPGRGGA